MPVTLHHDLIDGQRVAQLGPEAVLQLQHRAGERQVKGARRAVTTGYGMTLYRYGGTAAAAILERME